MPPRGAQGTSSRAQLRQAARSLATSLDVCGVYWGVRRKDGEWRDEPCLSVQVHKKHPRQRLPLSRMLPRKLDGVPVDVVEVGVIGAASLSHDDPVDAPGHRPSTITCLLRTGHGGCLALVSGHGTMPIVNGRISRSFTATPGQVAPIVARDATGETFTGQLLVGRIDAHADCAVASFNTLADVVHRLPGKPPPLAWRKSALVAMDQVRRHHRDGEPRVGIYTGGGLTSQPTSLHDGSAPVPYAAVIRIGDIPGGPPFARKGDSGSLVFASNGAAVGVVIAVTEGFTYLLPLSSVIAAFPQQVLSFFTEPS